MCVRLVGGRGRRGQGCRWGARLQPPLERCPAPPLRQPQHMPHAHHPSKPLCHPPCSIAASSKDGDEAMSTVSSEAEEAFEAAVEQDEGALTRFHGHHTSKVGGLALACGGACLPRPPAGHTQPCSLLDV